MNSNNKDGLLRIELGSGSRTMEGWTGVDLSPHAAVQCDLSCERLPFAEDSAEEIYASHFLEHFSFPDPMLHVLAECMRVLRPCGRLRIAVPDASIYIRAYMAKESFPEVIPVYKKAFFFNSPIDSINYIAYMAGQHKHMFDTENLHAIIAHAGFVNVTSREYDPRIDIEKRRAQSIYCSAQKPRNIDIQSQ